MENYIHGAAGATAVIILLICMLEDIRKKKISVKYIIVFLAVNLIMAYCFHNNIRKVFSGFLVGMIFLLISFLTKEKIGKADAWMISSAGIYFGFWNEILIVFTSMLLAAVYGVSLLIRKKGKDYEIAFLPFLFFPYAAAVVCQIYSYMGIG